MLNRRSFLAAAFGCAVAKPTGPDHIHRAFFDTSKWFISDLPPAPVIWINSNSEITINTGRGSFVVSDAFKRHS